MLLNLFSECLYESLEDYDFLLYVHALLWYPETEMYSVVAAALPSKAKAVFCEVLNRYG